MQGQELDRELWLRADPASGPWREILAVRPRTSAAGARRRRRILGLGISEAVANAVEHGAPCDNGLISVSLYIEAGCLTTEIRDCGDFKAARQPANLLEERGRGLPLMFAVMDHVEIDSVPGQTVVRLAKRLAA